MNHFLPEVLRGYQREMYGLRLLELSAATPTKRIAVIWDGKVLTGTASKHNTTFARKRRTMLRLKRRHG